MRDATVAIVSLERDARTTDARSSGTSQSVGKVNPKKVVSTAVDAVRRNHAPRTVSRARTRPSERASERRREKTPRAFRRHSGRTTESVRVETDERDDDVCP